MEIRSFFEPKSWQKYDIYWLLEIPCFELFGDWKYSLFWVKKLMKRLYLLVTEKFLFWTFRWWEIRSFFQPKIWLKDYIYVVFLSFLWYSRTWETWFFAQCSCKICNGRLWITFRVSLHLILSFRLNFSELPQYLINSETVITQKDLHWPRYSSTPTQVIKALAKGWNSKVELT